MKKILRILAFIVMPVIFCVDVHAAPPRDWKFLKNKPSDFRPCRTLSSEQIKNLQAKGAIRKAGKKGILSAETKKVIVVRVEFPGGPTISTSLADTEAFFARLEKYYQENSYGLLTVTSTVTSGKYMLPSSVSYYNTETESALSKLRADTISKVGGDIDFSKYDYLMIYHAGQGQEDSGISSDIWSMFYGETFTAGGNIYEGFTVVPELSRSGCSPLGVICHEFGHQLGLPDLYDTTVDGGTSTCGAWSLMDYPYGYDNTGKTPPHLDPWSKNYLQFIDLGSRVASQSISAAFLGDIETSQTTGFYKIPVDSGGNAQEYFIVENRQPFASKITYDLSLPGSGILIWHIDDSIALSATRLNSNTVNDGSPHLGVGLVAANGATDYPLGSKQPGVPFSQGRTFTGPQSNAFDGTSSNITLSDIAVSGDRADFKVTTIAAAATVKVNKLINYPNPAGSGYAHPRDGAGIVTTLVIQLSRPPQDMNMSIYNIAGERTNQVSRDKISLKIAPSSDYKWVYEYDWDGKNDSGENVAPGVYFYKVVADGDVKVGKLAIVR